MKLPSWLTPYRRDVLRWLILRDREAPIRCSRTHAIQLLLHKRVVSRIDGDFVLTPYGSTLLNEIVERKK